MTTTIAEPAQPARAQTSRTGAKLGFTSLESERTIESLEIEGTIPSWLSGSLLRTGPARFEAGGRSLRHWFDGQAMLHRFSFDGQQVSYANRFLRSKAFAETEKGRLGYVEFATDPCRSLFRRVQTLFSPSSGISDNCNVSVTRLGDEFIAMTETPMPLVFDPVTLETAGVAYEAPGALTTAHPHHDPDRGELVNYAVKLGQRSKYRFFGQRGRSEQRMIAELKTSRPAYVHSFGMSDRYLVLAEFPFVVKPFELALSGRPYIENYRWQPERGTRLHVFNRKTGDLHGSYDAEPGFCFHNVNCYEENGELICDLLRYDDPEIIELLYLDRLREGSERVPLPELHRYRIDLDSGRLSESRLAEPRFELPRINYARNSKPYRFVYGLTSAAEGGWLDTVLKLDVESGHVKTWHEEGVYPGEPVFVSAPEGSAEDDGVLLSVTLDVEAGSSYLLVLDAQDLTERARVRVPHHIPFTLHGQYTS